MKALVIKDFMVMRKAIKMWPVMLVVLIGCNSAPYGINWIFVASMYAGSTIAYDEQCGWNDYAFMLPYSKFDFIMSKYLVNYIFTGGVAVIAQLLGVTFNLLSNERILTYVRFDKFILELSIVFIFISISTWTELKYGYQKARLIRGLFLGLAISGSSFLGQDPIIEYGKYILDGYGLWPIITFVLAIVCNFISIQSAMGIEKE